MNGRYLLLGCVLVCACGDDSTPRCTSGLPDLVTIDPATVEGGPVGPADVTLRGQLQRPEDLTLYSLTIGGQLAVDEGDDFRLFSVKIPMGTAVDRSGDATTLPVEAETNCGSGALSPLPVTVPRSAKAMKITVSAVQPQGYSPIAPMTPVELDIVSDMTSHADADGLAVELTTTWGSLVPSSVVLRDDPAGANAMAYLAPAAGQGEAVVIAKSGALTSSTEVVFLGAPQLSPASTAIHPASPLDVIVVEPQVDGHQAMLDHCEATSAADITVTQPDAETFRITADASGVEGHAARITCVDVFGQISTEEYVIDVP